MSQNHPLDQTDRLILYLVRNLTKGAGHLLLDGGGVLTTMLAKLLFLIDVWSVETSGSPATVFRYIRYRYGPYPLAQFDERLERLSDWGLRAIPGVSVQEGKSYRIYRLVQEPAVLPDLPAAIKLLADEVMTTFATQRLEDVLEHVYSLDSVRKTPFGELVDLESLKPKDDVLTHALRVFATDLAHPISEEHAEAVERAYQEPSNENVEMARAMAEKQRRAFRLKQDS